MEEPITIQVADQSKLILPEKNLRPDSASDQLTPMPSYMRPVTRSGVHKWKKLYEDHMLSKMMEKRCSKKEINHNIKQNAHEMARKIPTELLANEWLKKHKADTEVRAYLVDHVLPTLILGCEKLLVEADQRNLAQGNLHDHNFNPINYLAKYLLKNNPRFSNFAEASPYVRGLREVGEQLKEELFHIEDNKLARMKAEAKKKRLVRESEEKRDEEERLRREHALRAHYAEWHDMTQVSSQERMQLSLLQNAVRSFVEVSLMKTGLEEMLEPTDEEGSTIALKQFLEYLERFIKNMTPELFDSFVTHLSGCAKKHRAQLQQETRHAVLRQLFLTCDQTGVGLLDRHRVLNLFEMFWDKANTSERMTLCNPRKWPVVELFEDIADTESEGEEEQETDAAETETDVPSNAATIATTADPNASAAAAIAEETVQLGTIAEDDNAAKADGAQIDYLPVHQEPHNEHGSSNEGVIEVEKEQPEKVEQLGKVEKSNGESSIAIETEPTKDPPLNQASANETNVSTEPSSDAAIKIDGDNNAGNQPVEESDTLNALPPQTADPNKPPRTQQSRVSFVEGTNFEREKSILTSHGTRPQSQMSSFDENVLNVPQFLQLTGSFLGDQTNMPQFQQLVRYVKDGYVETEEERMNRLIKAQNEAKSAKRKLLLNSVFEMWDNDASGFLDQDEVETIMKKYKDGIESEAVDTAKTDFRRGKRHHDARLSKREFREFVFGVVRNMSSGRGNFDEFVEYLLNSVERSYTERIRGEARKKWIQQIVAAAETSGAHVEPVYRAVFQALYRDAESHGGGKLISAYVAMLETGRRKDKEPELCLRYVAATSDCASYVLDKLLFRDMRGVSFASIDTGKPIHVPRVNNHGNIFFWNAEKMDEIRKVESMGEKALKLYKESDGSLIITPLKDRKKRTFGLLGIDTMNDPNNRAMFVTHEIQFYQGIAKALSIAYHHVDLRRKTLSITESAISWMHRRTPHVQVITAYMVEPDSKADDYVLRKMMATDYKGQANVEKVPPRLERKDNLFRDYLFKCVDTSDTITADAYGERHMAIPQRGDDGRAMVVIDISTGELKQLPTLEKKELMKMLKLLQTAYREIVKESLNEDDDEAGDGAETPNAEVLFDKLMLQELIDNVKKLDAKSYAEMKSYKDPPPVIHSVLKAVLAVFHPEKAQEGVFDDWSACKSFVDLKLSHRIEKYDPTYGPDLTTPVNLIHSYLADVPHDKVHKHGSKPAMFLYNWIFVCVSLIEHSRKTNSGRQKTEVADDQPVVEKEATS